MLRYRIIPVGDQALSIRFPNRIDASINVKIQTILKNLYRSSVPGVTDAIPAYASLKVNFNGLTTDFNQMKKRIEPIVQRSLKSNLATRIITIPVCYQKPYAPDLDAVARFAHTTPQGVIRMHTAKKYLIYFIGFLPGFAYMGKVDRQIAIPRLKSPRLKIPAGSVGIAGYQTGFYPVSSPGGWHLIGKTPLILFSRNHLYNFYHAGDLIQFKAVTKERFKQIHDECLKNQYQVKVVTKNV